jgi:hypothetical protein
MAYQLSRLYLSDGNVSKTSKGRIDGCRIGWLVGIEKTGFPIVDYRDNTNGHLAARYTISPGNGGWRAVWSANSQVVITFEQGDPELPIITGVMRSPIDEIVDETQLDPGRMATLDVKFDKRHLILDATEEIILRCGKGSITIHRDGKIIIKGTQLVSKSSGSNKIKGSAVQIN